MDVRVLVLVGVSNRYAAEYRVVMMVLRVKLESTLYKSACLCDSEKTLTRNKCLAKLAIDKRVGRVGRRTCYLLCTIIYSDDPVERGSRPCDTCAAPSCERRENVS